MERARDERAGGLNFVPPEDIVFFPARAFRATEAAHQQDCNSGGDNQRQKASARDEPVYKTMHNSIRRNAP